MDYRKQLQDENVCVFWRKKKLTFSSHFTFSPKYFSSFLHNLLFWLYFFLLLLYSGSFSMWQFHFVWQICLRLQSQRANTEEAKKKGKPTFEIGTYIEQRGKRERMKEKKVVKKKMLRVKRIFIFHQVCLLWNFYLTL